MFSEEETGDGVGAIEEAKGGPLTGPPELPSSDVLPLLAETSLCFRGLGPEGRCLRRAGVESQVQRLGGGQRRKWRKGGC